MMGLKILPIRKDKKEHPPDGLNHIAGAFAGACLIFCKNTFVA